MEENVVVFQELFHPDELRALVVGNEDYDFHELEKVGVNLMFSSKKLVIGCFLWKNVF